MSASAATARPAADSRVTATARAARAVLECHLVTYRRVWRSSLVSALATPVLLLLAIGVVVGSDIDRRGSLGSPYLDFVAPGLLVSGAMQLAMTEAGIAVTSQFLYKRTYAATSATPVGALAIVTGELAYLLVQIGVTASLFLAVCAAFGAVSSAWAVLAPVVAALTGLAGAAPMYALAAGVTRNHVVPMTLRLVMLPMTLLSGVFFPVNGLPEGVRQAAYVLPLWHGVALCRAATGGTTADVAANVGHAAVLLAWTTGGIAVARARFAGRLYR